MGDRIQKRRLRYGRNADGTWHEPATRVFTPEEKKKNDERAKKRAQLRKEKRHG